MPHHYIRELIGHRKDQLTRAYFYTPLNRLREEYFKYMPHLYLFEEIEVKVITEERLELMDNKLKEMEKAKVEIEKAKVEIKEYKEFVNGLEKDGLLNKKETYTIRHKDGELTVNGKKVSTEINNKYRTFLEKHKKFTIEKSDDDFDIDMD